MRKLRQLDLLGMALSTVLVLAVLTPSGVQSQEAPPAEPPRG